MCAGKKFEDYQMMRAKLSLVQYVKQVFLFKEMQRRCRIVVLIQYFSKKCTICIMSNNESTTIKSADHNFSCV